MTNCKRRFSLLLTAPIVILAGLYGCSAPPTFDQLTCDPKISSLADPWCRDAADAGTDADSDASSAKDDPGLEPSVFPPPNACKGDCVPEASDSFALDWPFEPLVVWFGPKSELAAKTCPVGTPYEKVRGFADLVAPPAKCDACACKAEGSCTLLPESIELRNGPLCMGESLPFGGPANWDGSCTTVNAIAAGTLCNGVLCAQSVSASALPGPTNESCTPTVEKPSATITKHEWLDGALACRAKDLDDGTCETKPEHCVEKLPEGWLHCLVRTGKHDVCPDNYNDNGPFWYYGDNPIDDRGCSECKCGEPTDGICIASLRLYSDSTCNNELNNNTIASTGPFCVDLVPPGPAIGGKKISNLSYVSGTCAVTGGEPIGTVAPDENAEAGAVTFCCRAPGPPPPKPPH